MEIGMQRSQQRRSQLSEHLFDESLNTLDGKYRNRFVDHHRRLKAAIHRCQFQAYSNEGLKFEECEARSRECFLPLLLIRRNATTVMSNLREEAERCLQNAASQVNTGNRSETATAGDPNKIKCLQAYKEELKKNVPKT